MWNFCGEVCLARREWFGWEVGEGEGIGQCFGPVSFQHATAQSSEPRARCSLQPWQRNHVYHIRLFNFDLTTNSHILLPQHQHPPLWASNGRRCPIERRRFPMDLRAEL